MNVKFTAGQKVICTTSCTSNGSGRAVKSGEILTINADVRFHDDNIWFTDTKDGAGSYKADNFELYVEPSAEPTINNSYSII